MNSGLKAIIIIVVLALVGLLFYNNYRITQQSSGAPSSVKLIVDNPDEVAWYTNFQEALQVSAQSGKPVMADFYADWCGWCKKLDEDTYSDSEVIKLSKGFVCVKVDADVDGASSKKYDIRGLPTILFTDAKGKVIHRIGGYLGPRDFASVMRSIKK
ncbi:MAG: thioredoxin family protein [Elusimicrobiota bacterium]